MTTTPEATPETHQSIPNKAPRCGGPTEPREIADNDKALFEEYRDIIEQKVREQFNLPTDFQIQPSKVRTQIVAGTNYYFHVLLPNGQFAHVKIFKPLKCHALQTADRSSLVTVDKEAKNE